MVRSVWSDLTKNSDGDRSGPCRQPDQPLPRQGEAVYVFPGSKGELRTSPKRKEVIAISKAAQEAGITCKVTPHVFRHTFATWTYECAKDPRKLQRLLRHASFDTSMGYVHEHADLASLVNQLPAMSRPRLKAA